MEHSRSSMKKIKHVRKRRRYQVILYMSNDKTHNQYQKKSFHTYKVKNVQKFQLYIFIKKSREEINHFHLRDGSMEIATEVAYQAKAFPSGRWWFLPPKGL